LDEYLQATLVTIGPGGLRFEMDLTPGAAVADQVLALVDRDHDGVVSTNEAAAYAALVRRDLQARLDGRMLGLKLEALNFPAPDEMRAGLGIIQLEFSAAPGRLAAGTHRLTFENRHLPKLSVYLFNAASPTSKAITIASQSRNQTQSTGEIDFTLSPPASLWAVVIGLPGSALAIAALVAARRDYVART
jgi:hypothetical protein